MAFTSANMNGNTTTIRVNHGEPPAAPPPDDWEGDEGGGDDDSEPDPRQDLSERLSLLVSAYMDLGEAGSGHTLGVADEIHRCATALLDAETRMR